MDISTLKILILGANGQIARVATQLFLSRTDTQLTLYLRNAKRLTSVDPERARVLEADVLDAKSLKAAMQGQDVVYANLAGALERQAHAIVDAMNVANVHRLIFISSMGVHDEVPGERFGSELDPYRKASALIEASKLNYTLIRPAWLSGDDEIDYEITSKGEPFKNAGEQVSRKSVADLVVKLAMDSTLAARTSLGVNKPA
jgi:uncharacterized protein YbjT (DUF2867 family)